MDNQTKKIRCDIIEAMLPAVTFDGWTMECAHAACVQAGYEVDMADAVFPGGIVEIVSAFSALANDVMLAELAAEEMPQRIRDRITLAVQKRFDFLNRYKEAEREAVAFWLRPVRKFRGAKLVWQTADIIWNWAGDTATDYNRYTKRTLLSGVLTATTLYWLGQEERDLKATFAFLDRRIDNVMTMGKLMAPFKNKMPFGAKGAA